jgi:hypothetical protein
MASQEEKVPPAEDHQEVQNADDDDRDESSSEGDVAESSSSESSDESDGEQQQPVDLRARLAAFLPELEKANQELKQRSANIEQVEEGEQYVEMNLGLGVLEQSNDDPKVKDSDTEDEPPEEPPTKRRKVQEVEN